MNFNFLLKPLGWILRQLSLLFGGNFAIGVFMFTLVVNVAMIPLSIKTQKSSVGQMKIKPKMDILKEKYGDDKQRYSQEMQKLYQQENISMSGGCLPMLIRFPIMLGIYQVVLKPLTYIVEIPANVLENAKNALQATLGSGVKLQQYYEPDLINKISSHAITGFEDIEQKLGQFNFNFLGIDLTKQPKFNIDIIGHAQIEWLIPVMAFLAALLTSIVSLKIQKKTNPSAQSMAGMMLTMPLISLFIGFKVSCAAGFYWACSSLIAGGIQAVLQYVYGPNKMIAAEQTKELYKRYKEETKIMQKVKE